MTTMTPTMTRTISDQELLALERSYWDALKDRDARTVGRLTAEQCTVAGASGASVVDPRSIVKQVEAATYRINGYQIDPKAVHINRFSDDLVAIAYGVHEDLEVDGKPVKLDAFDSSVWKKTENGWVCVLHTESLEGDPFGRDRMLVQSAS
jgi:ketosteroid isomerase-like protein